MDRWTLWVGWMDGCMYIQYAEVWIADGWKVMVDVVVEIEMEMEIIGIENNIWF